MFCAVGKVLRSALDTLLAPVSSKDLLKRNPKRVSDNGEYPSECICHKRCA